MKEKNALFVTFMQKSAQLSIAIENSGDGCRVLEDRQRDSDQLIYDNEAQKMVLPMQQQYEPKNHYIKLLFQNRPAQQ